MAEELNDPYLVIGTGRSGTSTVARILHENLGVFMGSEWSELTESNPLGAYEDQEFTSLQKKLFFQNMPYKEWHEAIWDFIRKRRAMGKPWGIKDPLLSHNLGIFLSFFKNPRIILCDRRPDLVIASLQKWYDFSPEYAKQFHDMRKTQLERVLQGREYLRLAFDEEKIPDKIIEQRLKRRWTEKTVYLAILNKGWLRREVAYHVIPRMKATPGVRVLWENPARSWGHPIGSNRCKIQQRFLESGADFLLMIDDDVIPYCNPVEFVFADKDIISFPAKVRQSERALNWVAYLKHPSKRGYSPVDFSDFDSKFDLYKMDTVGTGCILVKRKVLEAIPGAFKEVIDDLGIPKWGTDFAFCIRAKEMGFGIFTAPNHVCEHIKEMGLLDIQGLDDSDNRCRDNAPYKMGWGDWAISQKDWGFIKGIIADLKPKRILEFGSGLSSLLISELAEVVSYETDKKYAAQIRKKKTEKNNLQIRIWDGANIKQKLEGFDLVFVDGPTGKAAGGIGRQFSIKVASEASDHIILHDAGRDDEELWQQQILKKKRFHLEKRSGYHQIRCHYWKKILPVKMKHDPKVGIKEEFTEEVLTDLKESIKPLGK